MTPENRKAPASKSGGTFKTTNQMNRSQDTRSGLSRKPAFAHLDDAIGWILGTGAQLATAPAVLTMTEVALPVCWSILPGGAE